MFKIFRLRNYLVISPISRCCPLWAFFEQRIKLPGDKYSGTKIPGTKVLGIKMQVTKIPGGDVGDKFSERQILDENSGVELPYPTCRGRITKDESVAYPKAPLPKIVVEYTTHSATKNQEIKLKMLIFEFKTINIFNIFKNCTSTLFCENYKLSRMHIFNDTCKLYMLTIIILKISKNFNQKTFFKNKR